MKLIRRKYVLLVILGLAFVALLYGFFQTLKSRLDQPEMSMSMTGPAEYFDPSANPVNAQIGIHILSVGNLELSTGMYWMDFYLTIRCDRACHPDPDIINASSTPEIERQKADTEGDTFHFYRVRANLLTSVSLENYPFDEQRLVLEVGDKQATKSEMVFTLDPSMTDQSMATWDYSRIHVLGWALKPGVDSYGIEDAYPAITTALYSRYIFSVTIFKPWVSSFFNDLFPVIVIVLVGLFSFLMRPDAGGERLALTSSTLLAVILFHISLNSAIPPIGSLTYLDKFMLVNYVTITISTAISAILMVLNDNQNLAGATKLNDMTKWVVPLLWAFLLLGMTYWQFNGAQVSEWQQGLLGLLGLLGLSG